MELPPLTDNYFSANPIKEQVCRWLCLAIVMAIIITLYLFWEPLRNPGATYAWVSITLTNRFNMAFFRVVTTLGSEGFFLVMLSVIYWSFNKILGFWGLVLMPVSIFTTSEILKDIVQLPRPDVRGVAVPTYTFPSGHTSGAVSVWGYLAVMLKMRWLWIWALVIVFLVALSRIVLGYHYPGDVLGGIVTGIIFLTIVFIAASAYMKNNWNRSIPFEPLVFMAIGVPLLLSLLPVTYAPNLMGYLAGATSGCLLERKMVNFSNRGKCSQHLARALLGLIAIALIIPGINALFPYIHSLLTFAQHGASTFWITYLAPLLFVRTGLAQGRPTFY